MSEHGAIRVTTTETFGFSHDEIVRTFGDPPQGKSYDDWVLELFYEHNGSIYGDNLFSSLADQDSGMEVLPDGWDE